MIHKIKIHNKDSSLRPPKQDASFYFLNFKFFLGSGSSAPPNVGRYQSTFLEEEFEFMVACHPNDP